MSFNVGLKDLISFPSRRVEGQRRLRPTVRKLGKVKLNMPRKQKTSIAVVGPLLSDGIVLLKQQEARILCYD